MYEILKVVVIIGTLIASGYALWQWYRRRERLYATVKKRTTQREHSAGCFLPYHILVGTFDNLSNDTIVVTGAYLFSEDRKTRYHELEADRKVIKKDEQVEYRWHELTVAREVSLIVGLPEDFVVAFETDRGKQYFTEPFQIRDTEDLQKEEEIPFACA